MLLSKRAMVEYQLCASSKMVPVRFEFSQVAAVGARPRQETALERLVWKVMIGGQPTLYFPKKTTLRGVVYRAARSKLREVSVCAKPCLVGTEFSSKPSGSRGSNSLALPVAFGGYWELGNPNYQVPK